MTQTPTLRLENGIILNPAKNSILTDLLETYHEDPVAAQTALPCLNPTEDIRRQLRDMLFDIQAQNGTDQLHFWSIHQAETKKFIGLLGLGDELQSLHAKYNLGYWVRKDHQKQGIATLCVDAVFDWLKHRGDGVVVEIAVHPHNEAGLATASAICNRWNGERLEQFIGIEFNERTVPHHLHLVDIGRGETP